MFFLVLLSHCTVSQIAVHFCWREDVVKPTKKEKTPATCNVDQRMMTTQFAFKCKHLSKRSSLHRVKWAHRDSFEKQHSQHAFLQLLTRMSVFIDILHVVMVDTSVNFHYSTKTDPGFHQLIILIFNERPSSRNYILSPLF